MFQYHSLNPIAEKGLGLFDEEYKKSEDLQECDAVLVRSAKMHDMELPESVKVIARAGAGVNNIPVKDCAEKGVVVFNTPGANANGVKELVLAGMLLASRDIVGGIEWVAKEKVNISCTDVYLLLFTPFSVTFICFVNQNNDLPLSIVRSVKH